MGVIRTLNERNISRIRNEFTSMVWAKQIPYVKIGVFLNGQEIVFLIEQSEGKIILLKGEAEKLIGLTPEIVATDYANCLHSQMSG